MGDHGARPQADDLSESQPFAAALRFVRGRRSGRADCQVQSKCFSCLDSSLRFSWGSLQA